MIKICCDICQKQIKQLSPQPQGSCVCDAHLPFAEQFYHDQAETVNKAIDAHRNRFLQNVINRPKPMELVK